MPVAVRDIPSLADGTLSGQDGDDTSLQVSVLSLWDLLTTVPEPESNGAIPSILPAPSLVSVAAHPQQSALWE